MNLRAMSFFAVLILAAIAQLGSAARPNILFIITDDQAPHTLGAYGNTVCQTPNIDRIAREGMLLHDAHHMGSWSGAVCTPSRTMIMTGRSVWRIPGANKELSKEERREEQARVAKKSMPALFRAAGYDTFRTCKGNNSFHAADDLFEALHESTMRGPTAKDGSEWHANHALRYLEARAAAGDEDPFLMYVGFSHPHDPRLGSPELLDRYGAINTREPPTEVNPAAPPLPITYLPAHPFPHGHPRLRDEVSVSGVKTSRTEATIRNELGREYACIENIDIQVGRLLDKLEEIGQLDNTYVFFTSDHGIAVGRHGLTGKQNLYEHTWRVPMLVRGPGIQPGGEASGYVYLMDLLPTFCDIAGITPPDEFDGVSFRSVFEGRANRVRDVLYGVYCGGTKPGMRSVKTDGWKLIKYDVLDSTVRETQLFDLGENPNELLAQHHTEEVIDFTGNRPHQGQVDLAEDPAFSAKRAELEALLLEEQKRHDDPYRLWDQPE